MRLTMARRSFMQALIGNCVYAFANWAMLAVIAKLGTPYMLGQFALSVAIAQLIFVLTSFNLGGVLMTDARHEFRFLDYIGIRMFMTGVGILALVLICGFGRYTRETCWVILLNGAGVAIDSLSQLIYGRLALYSRIDRMAISMILKGSLSLVGVALGLLVAHSIVWAAAGSALASALVVLGYDLTSAVCVVQPSVETRNGNGRDGNRRDVKSPWRSLWIGVFRHAAWDLDAMRRLMILAAPMGVTVTLLTLVTNIPRLFLEHHLGTRELGLFAAPASFITIGRLTGIALDYASRSRLARCYADGDRAGFSRLLSRVLLAGGLFSGGTVAVAATVGRYGLRVLFTSDYAHNDQLLLISLLAGSMGYFGATFWSAMSAARHFRVQAPCMVFVVVATILASVLLIPPLGPQGAALASLIAMTVQTIIGAVVVKNIVRAMPQTGVTR